MHHTDLIPPELRQSEVRHIGCADQESAVEAVRQEAVEKLRTVTRAARREGQHVASRRPLTFVLASAAAGVVIGRLTRGLMDGGAADPSPRAGSASVDGARSTSVGVVPRGRSNPPGGPAPVLGTT